MNPLQQAKGFNFAKKNKKKTSFKCELCYLVNKKVYYGSKNSLKTHKLRAHKSKQMFQCDKCEKEFSRKDNLKTHVTSYHSKKKYSCPECNEAFTKKGLLIHHFQKVHVKNTYYFCTAKICRFKTHWKQSYSRHKKHCATKKNALVYRCFCGKCCVNHTALCSHMKICGKEKKRRRRPVYLTIKKKRRVVSLIQSNGGVLNEEVYKLLETAENVCRKTAKNIYVNRKKWEIKKTKRSFLNIHEGKGKTFI